MALWEGNKIVGLAPGQTAGSGAKEQAAADAAKAANDATITVYDKTTGQPTQVSKKTYDAMVLLGTGRYDLSKPPQHGSPSINKQINIPSVGGYTTFLTPNGEPFDAPTAQYQSIISAGGSLPVFTPSRDRNVVWNTLNQFEEKKKILESPTAVYASAKVYEQAYQETSQFGKVTPQESVFVVNKTIPIADQNILNKQAESDYIGNLIANQPRSGVKDYFVPGFGKMVQAKADPFTAGMEEYNGNAIDNIRTFNENVITGTKNIYNTMWNPVVQKGVEIINKNPEPFTRNVAKGVVEIGAGLPQLASGVILLPSAIIGSRVVERAKQTPKAAAETLVAPINEFNAEPTLAGKAGLATAYIGTAYVGVRGLKGVKSDILNSNLIQDTRASGSVDFKIKPRIVEKLKLVTRFKPQTKPEIEILDLTKENTKYIQDQVTRNMKTTDPTKVSIMKSDVQQVKPFPISKIFTFGDLLGYEPSKLKLIQSQLVKIKSEQATKPSFIQYVAITGAMASNQIQRTRQIANQLTEQKTKQLTNQEQGMGLLSEQQTKQQYKVNTVLLPTSIQKPYQITKQQQNTQQATQQTPISIALPKLDVPQKIKQALKFNKPTLQNPTTDFPKIPKEPTKKIEASDSSNDSLNFNFNPSSKSKKQSAKRNPWYPASYENATIDELLTGKRAVHIKSRKESQGYAARFAKTGQAIPTLRQSKSKKSLWR